MKFEDLTLPQQNAVKAEGSILVAAAAGSGKTAVLVERVLRLLSDTKKIINAENLLVVTFTNSAAAEMRGRIEKRINEECLLNPNNKHLQLQKLRIKNAKICTINSFCIDLVKNYFNELNLDPDIKITTEEDALDIREEVLSTLIEKNLKENTDEFDVLLQALDNGFGIKDFRDYVYKLYSKSKSMPFSSVWLDNCKNMYDCKFSDSEYFKILLNYAKKTANECIIKLNQAITEIKEDEIIDIACSGLFFDIINSFEDLIDYCNEEDWDRIVDFINNFKFEAFGNKLRKSENVVVKTMLSEYRSSIIASVENLGKAFYDYLEKVSDDMRFCGKYTNNLVDFVKEFGRIYEQKLVENNLMTFSMAEHFALNLLCEIKDGETEFKPLAKELSSIYSEVLVDEFQDVNNLQDFLFYALSDGGKNLFMVGDVKQSIYGFRNANPDNFLKKKESFYDYDEKNFPAKVILDANFRSRKGICNFINFLFEKIMSSETAGFVYDDKESLTPLAEFPNREEVDTDILLIDSSSADENRKDVEIKHIIQYIKSNVGKKIIRENKDNLRKAEYNDFAILLRSANQEGRFYFEALREAKIPVNFNQNEFESSAEILTVMSILKAFNNPNDNVSMLATITSPVFNFSFDDVASVRAKYKSTTLIGSLILAANDKNKKCEKFLVDYRSLKKFLITKPISEFLMYLYNKYSIPEIFSATENGDTRKSNLMYLIKLSESFGDANDFGVSAFIRYFDKMCKSGGFKEVSGNSDGDGVKIMSIHGSKGLQFPICILAQASKNFNFDDLRKTISISDNLGVALTIKNSEKKLSVTPVSKFAINLELKKKILQEEMRLLYVALTRAEDKLVVSIELKDLFKKISALSCEIGFFGSMLNSNELPESAVLNANSYSDLILSSLIFHPDAKELCKKVGIENLITDSSFISPINVIFSELFESVVVNKFIDKNISINFENIKRIKDKLSWKYPYQNILKSRAKAGVSEIIREDSSEFQYVRRPESMYNKGLTPTEKGNITHKVLELIDFKTAKNNLDMEINRLYEWEYLSDEELKGIDLEKISKFLNSSLCERILKSDFVKKEEKFIFKYSSAEDGIEDLIVQGCADLIFKENDKLIIVDFKTSRLDTKEEFKKNYQKQLDIYALALSEVYNVEVSEKIIYSLYLDKEVVI